MKKNKFCTDEELFKKLPTIEQSPLDRKIESFLHGIEEKKEEILKAFIAKHGFEPDECEIVVQGTSWFVRKKTRGE